MAVRLRIAANHFELIKEIKASISTLLRLRFGIFVSDFTKEGSFNRRRKTSAFPENVERFGAPISMVQYSDEPAALLLKWHVMHPLAMNNCLPNSTCDADDSEAGLVCAST